MLLNTARSGEVIQGGIAETTNFTIVADGKMFRLLSDTLYQNKIGSMVREVSCNALDAHVAAGKADVPFIIHAPNKLEPWFSVIDQGIGLSHDEVVNVFTAFGKSTKTDSNTQVGAFGFGSKTPFAYTNTFTVISIKDGIRNCYAAVVGPDNMPTMNLMDSTETQEGNGVEITIAVETYDYYEFYNEIAAQLRYFKVKPIIKGSSITFTDPLANVVEQFDDSTYFRKSGHIEVVQGGIAYPVDISQISKGVEKHSALEKFIHGAVYNCAPVFFFDIGQIAVTPSREAISYDAATIKNILDRMEKVRVGLFDRINAKMLAIPTIWEKTMVLHENSNFYSFLVTIHKNPWGVHATGSDVHIHIDSSVTQQYDNGNGKQRHAITRFKEKSGTQTFRLESHDTCDNLYPTKDTVIVVDDGAGAAPSRIRRYIQDTANKVYFFHSLEKKIESKYTKKDSNGKDYQYIAYADNSTYAPIDATIYSKFLDAVDGATIVYLSDLPKPERIIVCKGKEDGEVKERVKYTLAKAYRFLGFGSNQYHADSLKNFEKSFEAPKEMSDPAAYVVIKDRKVEFNLPQDDMYLFRAILDSKEFVLPVYAIREKDLPKIIKNPNWKLLKDIMIDERKVLLTKYKINFIRVALGHRDNSLNICNTNLASWLRTKRNELLDPALRKGLNRLHVKRIRNNRVCEMLYRDEIGKLEQKIIKQNQALSEKLSKRYEFLREFQSYFTPDENNAELMLEIVNGLYKKSDAGKKSLANN